MSWALKPESLEVLDARLAELKPRLIVEAGSGESTAVLSRHARTVSLEHLKKYAVQTRKLAPNAEVRLCKLRTFHTLNGNFQWYDTPLPWRIDFALIDGPPQRIGRQAALYALWPCLAPGWEIWLDDADRDHEQGCLKLWAQDFRFTVEPVNRWMVKLRAVT